MKNKKVSEINSLSYSTLELIKSSKKDEVIDHRFLAVPKVK